MTQAIPRSKQKCCARCIHWGIAPAGDLLQLLVTNLHQWGIETTETDRWKVCSQAPVAFANADYLCLRYQPAPRAAVQMKEPLQ